MLGRGYGGIISGVRLAGDSGALKSALAVASSPGQSGNEIGVLWRAEAEVEYGTKSPGVTRNECVRVKPQAVKNRRAENPVHAEREVHKAPVAEHEPEHLVRLERDDDVFERSHSLVVLQLWAEIGIS